MNLYSTGARAGAFTIFCAAFTVTLACGVVRLQSELARRSIGASANATAPYATWGQPAARWTGLATLVACVLYVVWSGVGQFVVDWQNNGVACEASVIIDVALYGAVKVLLYLFLASRAVVVITSEFGRASLVVWANLLVLAPILAVLPLMVVGRTYRLSAEDGTCEIGERRYTTAVVLGWDFLSTVYLSLLFAVPLFKHHFVNPQLRRVAIRSLIGGLAALVPTTANIVLLLIWIRENFRLCYMLCSADVAFQSGVVFLLTRPSPQSARLTSFSTEDPENRQMRHDVRLDDMGTLRPGGSTKLVPVPLPAASLGQRLPRDSSDASVIHLRLSNQFVRPTGGSADGSTPLDEDDSRRTSFAFSRTSLGFGRRQSEESKPAAG